MKPPSFTNLFSALPSPAPQLRASVIMPARDESAGIEKSLDCLANQVKGNGSPLDPASYEIILLANNCRDQTAAQARNWGQRHSHIHLSVVEASFEGDDACVGHARKLLMDCAAQRLKQTGVRAPQAICSTDADTRVSPHWIANTLAEMDCGARAVGGRIFLEPGPRDQQRRTYLFDTAYRLLAARLETLLDPCPCDPCPCDPCPCDPAPRHFQFFGASLAICPRLYTEIGGLPDVKGPEDMALSNRLRRLDIGIRHSPRVKVWTSARLTGRVEMGLSTQLSQWNGLNGRSWTVPSGMEIAFQARLRQELRRLWDGRGGNLSRVATQLMMCPPDLAARLSAAPFFGAVWEDLWNEAWSLPDFREQFPAVAVEEAVWQVREILAELTASRR